MRNDGYFDIIEKRHALWQCLLNALNNTTDNQSASEHLAALHKIEIYWAFPGKDVLNKIDSYIAKKCYHLAAQLTKNSIHALKKPHKRKFSPFSQPLDVLDKPTIEHKDDHHAKPVFDFLILHPFPEKYQALYAQRLASLQSDRDEHFYDLIFVNNIADAATALLSNTNIQAFLCLSHCRLESNEAVANETLAFIQSHFLSADFIYDDSALLAHTLAHTIRPEVSTYYMSENELQSLPALYFSVFQRIFYHIEPFKDVHYHALNGVRERFNTPFYHALQSYSQRPKGVFHALPISRGNSIKDSVWLEDFHHFYGNNIFAAETSSTQGGMDSLLNPKGAIKHSQEKAAKCFGAGATFFVTNGTSTSNKIVVQANITPGDIILVSSDCHKSIPYSVMLTGAHVIFLQTNAVEALDIYGGVGLTQIKDELFALKTQNLLHKVKAIVLTNSTFDGLMYDVEEYMYDILAIKPDIIFHWDEAWFAHAHFHCLYLKRHAMNAATRLRSKLNSYHYLAFYNSLDDKSAHPDPTRAVLRVYATQSTHKTLSSFRQGSMIHVYDEAYNASHFLEAFYTHTSTSPNYQILASLDIARRQVDLEGYARIHLSIYLAYLIRKEISTHPVMSQIFRVLNVEDIYPNNTESYSPDVSKTGSLNLLSSVQKTGFAVDITRITLDIRKTNMDGCSFRKLLIDKYDIQVNKTSKHTVLFIVNIGTNAHSAQFLLDVLTEIAERLLVTSSPQSGNNIALKAQPALPKSRQYHALFHPYIQNVAKPSHILDLRKAYYAAYDHAHITYIKLTANIIEQAHQGKTWVAATFITPYPPGFPLLVPGQIITVDILEYFASLNIKEIHGYIALLGIKVFADDFLCVQHVTSN